MAASHLPQDILARWVQLTAPVLDLREVSASVPQWTRLLTVLQQYPSTVTELRFQLPVTSSGHFDEENTGNAAESSAASTNHSCLICRHSDMYSQSLLQARGTAAMARACARCSNRTVTHSLFASDFTDAIRTACRHMPKPQPVSASHSKVLHTLAGVVPYMSSLHHVGLHHLPLQAPLMPSPGQVLLALPPSLTSLTLDTCPLGEAHKNTLLQLRSMLFIAIAIVQSLRELRMPASEDIVGQDVECVQPLYRLPHLHVVLVREVKDTNAFPAAALTFKALSDAN